MKKVVLSAASIAASFLLLCAAAPFSSAAVSDSHLVAPVVSGETGNRTEEDNVKALYRKYENNPAVTTVYVSSAMFDLLRNLDVSVTGSVQVDGDGGSTDVDTEELSQMFATISSLTGLYILSTEDQAVASDMRQNIRVDGDYVQLMKVKDGGDKVDFYYKSVKDGGDKVDFYYKSPDGKRIVEFLMLADSDEETVVIQFESDSLTFDDVAGLAAIMAQGE